MAADSLDIARKSYRTSLRAKLKSHFRQEAVTDSTPDRRWLNGFMAAGFHSGLISLSELKIECSSAFKAAYGRRMTDGEEHQLERRLSRLCQLD